LGDRVETVYDVSIPVAVALVIIAQLLAVVPLLIAVRMIRRERLTERSGTSRYVRFGEIGGFIRRAERGAEQKCRTVIDVRLWTTLRCWVRVGAANGLFGE
jgi:hypothetical protein